jgi:primosomal protein N'
MADLGILGPIEAPLARIADHYRWQTAGQGAPGGYACIASCANSCSEMMPWPPKGDVNVSVDVDPVFLM